MDFTFTKYKSQILISVTMASLKYCIDIILNPKVILTCLDILVFCGNCPIISQVTFSERIEYGFSTQFRMVIPTTDGYLAIAEANDLDGTIYAPLLAVQYNLSGEWIETKAYGSEDFQFQFEPLNDTDARLNDSTLIVLTEKYLATSDEVLCCLIWMKENGDTLQTRTYSSPFYNANNNDTNWNRPTALDVSDDGQFIYYVAQVVDSPPLQNTFIVRKLNAEGDIVWTYMNPFGWYYNCNTLTYFNGNPWLVSESNGFQNQFNVLRRLDDSDGTLEFEVELQGESFPVVGCRDIVINPTGVFCACVQLFGINGLPTAYGMNYNGEYLWHSNPNETAEIEQDNNHIVQSSDGGYVSCSIKYDEQPNPEAPNDPSSNNTEEKIWLWKVDSDGNFLWQRFYEYLSFDSGYFYLHNIAHDMKATPDGGYIMAGETTSSCLDWPECDNFSQQGWLLKVDGCGCLVPGCDETCIVNIDDNGDNKLASEFFKIGPNPTIDMLNFYISNNPIPNTQYLSLQILDMNGNLIHTFNLKNYDITYMIDTSSLSSGTYMLNLINDGRLIQSEKFLKE